MLLQPIANTSPATRVLATWADIEKSKDKLGWKPTVSIEVGVQNTVDWYLKNREFLNRIKD
ncbi:MAG: hypothetical protein Q8M34_07780 [Thermodesulfovibrionales bacterium]|nr:hypothetical protein [Thermodesulfovibrionales bacterium]